MSDVLLQAENVGIRFGGLQALEGLNLTVRDKELCCIIGPNGAGKSTFLNVLTGTLRPTSGSVRFLGHDIAGLPLHRIARLGIARKFQIPSVFPSLSVEDNLKVARWGAPSPARPIGELMELVALTNRAARLAGELAHGQKQWLEIGMALAIEPRLLLLDEPTAGMTPQETLATAEMLLRLKGEFSIVAVEHDIRFVRALNCETLVLHQGRRLRSGPFHDIEADEMVRDVYLGRR
ncbi:MULTISPECIES: ATP-binding cassette domain-containing protein [unclassified Mesorhizobium]|uniref:ATP-binding cassette domain-containing protein n=1 Tax=unclassified Mesorhizobium TaxID=325217 RepID=UPI000FDAA8F6|nr:MULTISPECIES: ATP-binding cassette domain-containing protein [unclassified Mesorhizobium]RWC76269.1 MAG: ATP-binding cassette domain-containing protein [Mesorhizobium sp.]TGR44265.1 ATP-binding cassette domain-containing protein [bacterium M00.F.Ca.ET.199.01.1.1]TGU33130.1 ATP-binding cassette domain-containing protein [bacterium M00.F.Ca.ET.156.01.1.1]TGV87335.1 ATP-binding cassette domain-containing protein [Mesorhizobium sp. M00.F.Ca.ET.149.01.1.1]TGR27419.1 ATP-binding cassette domain-c